LQPEREFIRFGMAGLTGTTKQNLYVTTGRQSVSWCRRPGNAAGTWWSQARRFRRL